VELENDRMPVDLKVVGNTPFCKGRDRSHLRLATVDDFTTAVRAILKHVNPEGRIFVDELWIGLEKPKPTPR